MSASQLDDVRAVVGPAVNAAGLVLEGVTISPAGRRRVVRIVVDLPEDRLGGVPLDDVAEASRAVSAALDAHSVLGQSPYVLEVTSPGVDRPLTERRHWMRARRRLVAVQLRDGTTSAGRLVAVDDDGLTLAADGEGTTDTRLAWDGVVRGQVQVEFGRPGELDDDADEAPDPAGALDAGRSEGDDRPTDRRRR